MSNYIEEVSQILTDMDRTLEDGQEQTNQGLQLMHTLEGKQAPQVNLNEYPAGVRGVTLHKKKVSGYSDFYEVKNYGIVIGYLAFIGNAKTDMWYLILEIDGVRRQTQLLKRNQVLRELYALFDEFNMVIKEGVIVKRKKR